MLVYAADPPADADGVRAVLDGAWDAIRAHAPPPERRDGLIVLIAPGEGDATTRPRARGSRTSRAR